MRDRAVQVGDVEMAIVEAGEGGRPFLLMHGFTGAKEDFARGGWLERLAGDGWHAVALDHRGHGSSSKPESEDDYSFEIIAADALGLCDALGWSSFTLLGHSMGGIVAQLMVAEAPERVAALVLMDTGPGALQGLSPEMAEKTGSISKARGMRFLCELQKERGGALDTPASRALKASDPAYSAWADSKLIASSPFMYAAMIRRFAEPADRLEALRSVSVPTLVIVGEQDQPFVKPSQKMAAAVPGARLAVIPDAGHSPQFENPDGWWAALSGFLQEVAGG
jgi:pimeloyl-ACP methyl ester carboxylesterase